MAVSKHKLDKLRKVTLLTFANPKSSIGSVIKDLSVHFDLDQKTCKETVAESWQSIQSKADAKDKAEYLITEFSGMFTCRTIKPGNKLRSVEQLWRLKKELPKGEYIHIATPRHHFLVENTPRNIPHNKKTLTAKMAWQLLRLHGLPYFIEFMEKNGKIYELHPSDFVHAEPCDEIGLRIVGQQKKLSTSDIRNLMWYEE